MKPAPIKIVIARLKKKYPAPAIALRSSDPFQLLVATILSAQCTDARVNIVTRMLFKKYRRIEDYARADVSLFEKEIRSTGFYRNKARHVIGCARRIIEDFGAKVPDTMEEMLTLPGVARKTANVVLYSAFGKNEGIAVDTHVNRVSRRLGLTVHEDPAKIEQDLMRIVPRKEWGALSLRIIKHGRDTCHARTPECGICILGDICPSRGMWG